MNVQLFSSLQWFFHIETYDNGIYELGSTLHYLFDLGGDQVIDCE